MAKLAYWATPVVNPAIYIYSRQRYKRALIKVLKKFKILRWSGMFGPPKKSEQLTWN